MVCNKYSNQGIIPVPSNLEDQTNDSYTSQESFPITVLKRTYCRTHQDKDRKESMKEMEEIVPGLEDSL